MDEIIIKKAKMKEGWLTVSLEEKRDEFERTTTVRSCEPCHEDLRIAFDNLEPVARKILQLPSDWRKGQFRIVGVSWSKSETTGVEGAVITGQIGLETADAPFNFNTPHLAFDQYSPSGNSPIMPSEGIDALEAFKGEVQAFLDGKRAHGDLFERVEEKFGIPADVAREFA
jgi:hypothetical protein